MESRWRLIFAFATAGLGIACTSENAPPSSAPSGAPADLVASTQRLYQRYGAALAGGNRAVLADFYHVQGARLVFNGAPQRLSQAQLRELYTTVWERPAYFAWDSLTFDSLSTTQVLVNGGFRWQAPGTADTVRFIYAALLVVQDSSMAIVFEHETPRPPAVK